MTTKTTTGIYKRGWRYVDREGKFLGITLGQAVRAMAARPRQGRHAMTIGDQFRLALAGA